MSYSLSLERFAGKVAVVTGASSGIGKAIVESLVKQGLIVAGLARRIQLLKEHAEQLSDAKGKLHPYQCDLTKEEDILTTFKKITTELGPIYILVNNAGVICGSNIIDGDIQIWKTTLDTNVLSVAITTRETIANMKAHNIKGHIININSIAGHNGIDSPLLNVYPASKHALTALTETVRLEINREKLPIKITSLSPGAVDTELIALAFGEEGAKRVLSKPVLLPEDIADAALYILATPEHVNVKELTVCAQGVLM